MDYYQPNNHETDDTVEKEQRTEPSSSNNRQDMEYTVSAESESYPCEQDKARLCDMLDRVESLLYQMLELASYSASDECDGQERIKLQEELSRLQEQLERTVEESQNGEVPQE